MQLLKSVNVLPLKGNKHGRYSQMITPVTYFGDVEKVQLNQLLLKLVFGLN